MAHAIVELRDAGRGGACKSPLGHYRQELLRNMTSTLCFNCLYTSLQATLAKNNRAKGLCCTLRKSWVGAYAERQTTKLCQAP